MATGNEVVHYGMGVSLRLQNEWCMFLSSRGVADPKLSLRSRDGNAPLLQFDRCVFRIQPVTQLKNEGPKVGAAALSHQPRKATNQGPVLYGRPVHIVHSYSGLYVTIVRKPAETDSTHFRVVLMTLEDAGSACRFKILPRYKIRAEGDPLHNNDVIYLQQDSSMLSLHGKCSPDATDDEMSEVTATEKATPLELSLYDTADITAENTRRHKTLMAGSATMLFHRERDSLLTIPSALEVAEETARRKSMSNMALSRVPPLSNTSGLLGSTTPRQTRIAFPFFKAMKTAVSNLSVDTLEITCNSLWFFENIDPTIGGPIGANMPCRLRHGVTGKYLFAEENPLTKEFDVGIRDLETLDHYDASVFELELVASSIHSIEIYSEKSFVVARHQMTGRYLTTSKNGPHGALLGLTPHLNLEDTLAVVTVPREKQQELTFLIGNVEFLTKYIRKFYAMQSPSSKETVKDASVAKVIARATESLTALIRFCTESADEDPLTREGLALGDHQESMFQVSLHKIAMEVLLCPFVDAGKENKMELPLKGGVLSMEDVLKDEYANVHTVCRLCYRLLKQMSKSSPHAALLIDYVDFMQAQEGYKLHVADTLMEIFTDNPNLPPERCETDIRHFVSLLLKKGRSSGYLKFLSRLCVVNDTGVAQNQRLVAHLVLDKYRNDILYQTAIRENTLMILLPKFVKKAEGKDKKKDKGEKKEGGDSEKKEKKDKEAKKDDEPPVWVPLGQFLNEGDSKMVKFFESSVELLGNLCIGAEEECLRLASQIMPVDQLLVAIDPNFPASYPLRSSYFTLALHLYLRKMLFNAMKVNNRLMSRTTCGSLVLSRNVEVEQTMLVRDAAKTISADEQATLAGEDRVMTIIKRRALEYLQACRRTLVDPGATRLVSTISTIWHTFVSYSQYTKQEALDLVEAVIGVMDSRDEENRYIKNEFTIVTMAAKRSLCQFLLNVLKHDVSELADVTVSRLVDTGFDDAVKVCEEGVTYLQTRLFNLPKVLPVLVDLLGYHDNHLVSSALELITAVCNVGATVAEQIGRAEPIRTVAAGRAFRVFLAAQSALQQNLSVSGHIIDEQATIDIVSAIVNIDSGKILRNDPVSSIPAVSNDSLIRAPSEAGGRLKAKVSSIMAVARIFSSVREKRQKWRSDDPSSREVARLLFRSEVHRNLQVSLEAAAPGSKIQQSLLEFFRILSIDPRGAADIARYLNIFEKCVFNDATCIDAAAILFNVVKYNRRLAADIGEDTINHLVTLLSVRHEASLAEGLEAMVLGDSPVERNQKQVLAQLIGLKLLVNVSSFKADWSSQQMSLNSAVVNLMACCCVDNATCRASVSKVLRADEVIRILIANQTISDGKPTDLVSTAHLTPYLKYLAAAPLSVDSESTAQELTMLRKQWTENSQWWTLVSAVFFPRLNVPEGGFNNVEQEEYVFDGILLAMTSYLTNLYDPQVALKARYATPISDIANKTIKFASDVVRNAAALKPRYLLVTIALLRSIKRSAKLSLAQFDLLQREFTTLKTTYAERQQEVASKTQSITIERATEFAARWEKNSAAALAPLTVAITGGGPDAKIFDSTIERPECFELHKKLVHHLFRKELSDEATVAIFSVFKHSVAGLEDKGEETFAKGQLYLNDIGLLRVVTEIISSCSDLVAQEAFNLAIVNLEGGNTDVQNSLLSHFMSTDERFFHDIGRMVTAGVEQSRNRRTRELHAAFYGDDCTGVSTGGKATHILEVFRFLQLMCEGHHGGLQNYLRDQDDNLRSVNVVKEVLSLTMELVRSFDGTEFALLQQALALLTEVCQGPCAGNQDLLTQTGTCAMLNTILTAPEFAVTPPYDSEQAANLLQLKRGAVTTLLALLEGVRDETIPLIVFSEVPVAGLEALIEQFIGTEEFANTSQEDLCELVFSAVITLHSLVQGVSNNTNRDRIAAQQVLAKHEHAVGRLGLIEIERNNQLENVYFRVPNICSLLTEDSRQQLLWSVDRSTQGSKLSDFLDKVDELIYDIEATHRVKGQMGNSRLLAVVSKVSINTWDDMSLAIAMFINILFVAVISDAKGLLDKDIEWLGVEGLIRILAFAQCVCCTAIMVMDGITNFPLVLYKQSKEIEDPRWYHKALAIVKRKETVMRFTAFAFAVMGVFVNDFFFAIHLLGLISKSSVLKNVVVAVTQNGKSLLLTAMLGCIIIYLFSLIGFVAFQDHFEEACGTLSQCVVHILSTGLRQGGGIGDAMSAVKYGEPNYYGRLLYDSLFWAFMIVIFLNILFGIIIDTFAELRDDKSKKEEDMHTKCFICGIDSYTFDRYGEGFEKHVKQEHNMWAYLYFIHHLRRKDKNDYTGQESYVADLVEKGDIAFFPAGKARSINKILDQVAEEGGEDDGSAPTASAGAAVASRGGGGGGSGDLKLSARGDHPVSPRGDGEEGAGAVDPAMLSKIMAKLDQLAVAQAQQQAAAAPLAAPSATTPGPSNQWLSKLADVSRKAMIANRGGRREDSPTQQTGAESPASANASLTPASDVITLRDHKSRIDMLQAAADKARETATAELKEAFVFAVNRLGVLLSRQAQLAEEAQNATIDAYSQKAALLVDSVALLNAEAAGRAVAAEKQTNLLTLELDGLRSLRDAERKKRFGSADVSGRYEGLMKEGENYIQLLRSAVREGRAHTSSPSRLASSPETN